MKRLPRSSAAWRGFALTVLLGAVFPRLLRPWWTRAGLRGVAVVSAFGLLIGSGVNHLPPRLRNRVLKASRWFGMPIDPLLLSEDRR